MRNKITGFSAVYTKAAEVLVLGSMPGQCSLDEAQYYAHPRNLFWPFMMSILGHTAPNLYEARLTWLKSHKVALWDVLAACHRKGSLDANIDKGSVELNDIPALCSQLTSLKLVVFNGRAAETLFNRHFKDLFVFSGVRLICLPSTSPANAGMSYDRKLDEWRNALSCCMGEL